MFLQEEGLQDLYLTLQANSGMQMRLAFAQLHVATMRVLARRGARQVHETAGGI